jgi:hypothetical protein
MRINKLSESSTHIILVQAILNWIYSETIFYESMAILVSNPNTQINEHPPIIGRSIPDVFASSNTIEYFLIGEAKTSGDIETNQTRKQFADYLEFLSAKKDGLLVIAVPWYCTIQTRSLIKSIQRRTATVNVKFRVLDKLPG